MTGRNLNIYFTEKNFNKIKEFIPKKEVSRFVNKAVDILRKQLIADYQDAAQERELNVEIKPLMMD